MKEIVVMAGILIAAKLLLSESEELENEHYIIMNEDIYYSNIDETIRIDTTLMFPIGYPSDQKYTYYIIAPSGNRLYYGYKTSEMYVDGFNINVKEFGEYHFYMISTDTGEQYDVVTFEIREMI